MGRELNWVVFGRADSFSSSFLCLNFLADFLEFCLTEM